MLNSSDTSVAPAELLVGARNAVRTCMAIAESDRVIVITDRDTERIGLALGEESWAVGAVVEMMLLEEFGERPFTSVLPRLTETLRAARPTATFFAAQGLPGESAFRIPLRHLLIGELGVRHAHMIHIDERLMVQGMRADYRVVSQVVQRVTDWVQSAREMHVTNPKGTDLRVTLSPQLLWRPCSGIYHRQGEWGNLPEGETFTCPADAEGVVVAEVLGDYFSRKYGVLRHPVSFRLAHGRVIQVECENRALQGEVEHYLAVAQNGNRVGEFAIGANLWVKAPVGNMLQDEKIPGVHVAFWDPYPEETGADWSAKTHLDVVPTECSLWADGRLLMRDGQFEPEVLQGVDGMETMPAAA